MSTRYVTGVFATAALFNVIVGASGLLAPDVLYRLLGVSNAGNPVFVQTASWLILLFGVGYGMVARNPERNRDLMLLGGVGKLFVFPLMLVAWRRGDVAASGVAAAFGDLVFALLFFDILRRTAPPRRA